MDPQVMVVWRCVVPTHGLLLILWDGIIMMLKLFVVREDSMMHVRECACSITVHWMYIKIRLILSKMKKKKFFISIIFSDAYTCTYVV